VGNDSAEPEYPLERALGRLGTGQWARIPDLLALVVPDVYVLWQRHRSRSLGTDVFDAARALAWAIAATPCPPPPGRGGVRAFTCDAMDLFDRAVIMLGDWVTVIGRAEMTEPVRPPHGSVKLDAEALAARLGCPPGIASVRELVGRSRLATKVVQARRYGRSTGGPSLQRVLAVSPTLERMLKSAPRRTLVGLTGVGEHEIAAFEAGRKLLTVAAGPRVTHAGRSDQPAADAFDGAHLLLSAYILTRMFRGSVGKGRGRSRWVLYFPRPHVTVGLQCDGKLVKVGGRPAQDDGRRSRDGGSGATGATQRKD
jgi:hypothetical protein